MANFNNGVNNLLRNQPVTAPVSGTAYTALATDRYINITATGAFALTLPGPSVSNNVGQVYTVKDVAGNAERFNISITSSSGTIDGTFFLLISENYGSVSVYSDGTNYWISDQEISPAGTQSFFAYLSVAATNATGNGGLYNLGNTNGGTTVVSFDNGGNTSFSSGFLFYTVPIAGIYYFKFQVVVSNVSALMTEALTYIGGTSLNVYSYSNPYVILSPEGSTLSADSIFSLPSGSQIFFTTQIIGGISNTVTINGTQGSGQVTYAMGYRIA